MGYFSGGECMVERVNTEYAARACINPGSAHLMAWLCDHVCEVGLRNRNSMLRIRPRVRRGFCGGALFIPCRLPDA